MQVFGETTRQPKFEHLLNPFHLTKTWKCSRKIANTSKIYKRFIFKKKKKGKEV
jgi:hypothetical protein